MSDTRIIFLGEAVYSKQSVPYGSYKYLRALSIGQGQAPALQSGSTFMMHVGAEEHVDMIILTSLSDFGVRVCIFSGV